MILPLKNLIKSRFLSHSALKDFRKNEIADICLFTTTDQIIFILLPIKSLFCSKSKPTRKKRNIHLPLTDSDKDFYRIYNLSPTRFDRIF